MNFYENFLKLCNKVGKSPSKVLLEIGGTKSAVTRWKNGGNPTDATVQKIADYFGVKTSDLMDDVLWLTASNGGLERAKSALERLAVEEAVNKIFVDKSSEKSTPTPSEDDAGVLTKEELARISAAMAEMNEEGRERAVETVEDMAAGGRFKKHCSDAMDKEA